MDLDEVAGKVGKKSLPFNMALMYLEELHLLRLKKHEFYFSGDLLGYRDVVEEIFTSLSFLLTADEVAMFEGAFSKISGLLVAGGNANLAEAKRLLRKMDVLLVRVAYNRGVLFPKSSGAKENIDEFRKMLGLSNEKEGDGDE